MKIGRIIHQQMMQLRWHFLACLGLMMALPIEEGIINVRDGAGFYATPLSLGIPITVAPLLAGLIACANIQADLDDRRYIFWRSKPVGVKSFMAIKYLVGLLVAFVVIALPVVFAIVSSAIADADKIENGFDAFIVNILFISLLVYSLCFFCNVLVRKTARAWLIGMALTCFLLLVPFILPLNFKDVTEDFLFVASVIYISVTVAPSLVAFVVSLLAANRDWHLQTNLKGLLWTGAALIFLVMLLFTHQVANIKVLDEKEVYNIYHECVINIEGEMLIKSQPVQPIEWSPEKQMFEDVYINAENNQIQFETIDDPALRRRGVIYAPEPSDEHATGSPIFKINEGNLYVVSMYVSSRRIKPSRSQTVHENVYIKSYNISNPKSELVSEIDLSEFSENPQSWPDVVMRRIGDKIVAIVNRSCVVVEFGQNGQLKVLEKKRGEIGVGSVHRDKLLSIPMVPLETIEPEDRIRLSLDLGTIDNQYYLRHLESRVDKHEGKYHFVNVGRSGIVLYEVIHWDDKLIKCELKDIRPFTILESMTGDMWKYGNQYFVKNGKLYVYDDKSIMIFDIRSDRIRKLGHYVRPKEIEDIEVLDDGNILLVSHDRYEHFSNQGESESVSVGKLQLLKNPE